MRKLDIKCCLTCPYLKTVQMIKTPKIVKEEDGFQYLDHDGCESIAYCTNPYFSMNCGSHVEHNYVLIAKYKVTFPDILTTFPDWCPLKKELE